jgi:hypothetical protein
MTARAGQLRQDNGDGTTMAGQSGYVEHWGQDQFDRTAGKDQSRQVSLTGEPGQTERTSQDNTATTGQHHQESSAQDC